jgi:hypothetical protein
MSGVGVTVLGAMSGGMGFGRTGVRRRAGESAGRVGVMSGAVTRGVAVVLGSGVMSGAGGTSVVGAVGSAATRAVAG